MYKLEQVGVQNEPPIWSVFQLMSVGEIFVLYPDREWPGAIPNGSEKLSDSHRLTHLLSSHCYLGTHCTLTEGIRSGETGGFMFFQR